jgi:predicted lipid-binding transport protein (Tim44 family)
LKKLFVFTFLLIFALQNISFAAVSSSKTRSFSTPPKPPTTQTAPSPSSGYKPSAPANSYSQTAPSSSTKSNSTAAQPPANSGFMRGLGMFGGGMLLGSLLGGSLGFGSGGLFSTLAGVFLNIILIGGILMAIRFVWDKFKQHQHDNRR